MSELVEVHAILEVSAEYEDDLGTLLYGPDDPGWDAIYLSGHDDSDVQSVRDALERSAFKGHDVRYVDMPNIHDEEPTTVPHFDYGAGVNERDDNGDLIPLRDDPVMRMFGLKLILVAGEDAEDAHQLFGNYRIMPGVRISISGYGVQDARETTEREEVDDAAPTEEGIPANWFTGMRQTEEEFSQTYPDNPDKPALTTEASRYYREHGLTPPYER